MVDSRNGAYKMNPEYLAVSKSNEMLKLTNQATTVVGMSKGHRSQLKVLPLAKGKTIRSTK